MTMRILVCGGRDFLDRSLVFAALDAITPRTEPDEYGNDMPQGVTIIHGACQDRAGNLMGADLLADEWAVCNWTGLEAFPADWNAYGKAAGPIRNRQMLVEGQPDLVVAFPGGRGTKNMVDQARARNVEVRHPVWGNLLGQ